MKLIKYKTDATADELVLMLSDNERVNKNVNISDKKGIPYIHCSRNGNKLKLTCEFKGGATKDNAFLSGTTALRAKIIEKNGETQLRGVITTAPIFHAFLFSLLLVSIVMCVVNTTFNVTPICLAVFDLFMYKDEFRKQGIIERYTLRAIKRLKSQ